jgi:hypothetical protein
MMRLCVALTACIAIAIAAYVFGPAAVSSPPAPICRVEGCCPGRGEIAYVQPDLLVICGDGLPSEICDCH